MLEQVLEEVYRGTRARLAKIAKGINRHKGLPTVRRRRRKATGRDYTVSRAPRPIRPIRS
jgi:hypothetical protein